MLSLLKKLADEPPPTVQAEPARCLRRRLNTCDCRLCLDACAAGALSLDGRQLQLDARKCTGCMVCLAVCPGDALVGSWDLEGMLRQVRERAHSRVVISCIRQKRRTTEEMTVPCLGILGGEALVALGRSGCQSIDFDLAGCPLCVNRPAASRFLAILGQLQQLAAPVLSARLSVLETEREPPSETNGRRSFLAEIRSSLTILNPLSRRHISGELPASRPEKTRGRRVPIRVKIIERVLADTVGEEKEQLVSLCTHRLNTSQACDCCPLCTGICPTGALRLSGSGTDKQLLFTGARCSGCGLCAAFCRKGALSLFLSPVTGIPVSLEAEWPRP